MRTVLGQRILWCLGLLVVLATAALAGFKVGDRPQLLLALALALLTFLVGVTDASLLAMVCLPLMLVVQRVAIYGTDLSVSDLTIFVCALAALVSMPRPLSTPMRGLLWAGAAYQALVLPALVAHPYTANYVEWAHEVMLWSGALLVGWTLGASGRAAVATKILLVCGMVLALATIVQGVDQWLHGNTGPVYLSGPLPMHKNAVGAILGVLAVLAYARRPWMRLPVWASRTAFVVMLVGAGFTQARQGLVALVAGVLILLWLRPRTERRTTVIVLAAIPFVAFLGYTVLVQLQSPDRFNSANERVSSWSDTMAIWRMDPVFGQGLRWWYRPEFDGISNPPNGVAEMLTSAGYFGLLAVSVLFVAALAVLWRVDRNYSALAIAVLAGHLLRSQLDTFWLTVTASLPLLVVGLCLGAQRWDHPSASAGLEPAARSQAPGHVVGTPAP